jgi:hypothetical protein
MAMSIGGRAPRCLRRSYVRAMSRRSPGLARFAEAFGDLADPEVRSQAWMQHPGWKVGDTVPEPPCFIHCCSRREVPPISCLVVLREHSTVARAGHVYGQAG